MMYFGYLMGGVKLRLSGRIIQPCNIIIGKPQWIKIIIKEIKHNKQDLKEN
jgi:hypothetical protein